MPLANILNYFLEPGPYVYVQKASDLRCLLSMTASPRVEAAHRQHEAMSVSPVLPETPIAWFGSAVPLDVDPEPRAKL